MQIVLSKGGRVVDLHDLDRQREPAPRKRVPGLRLDGFEEGGGEPAAGLRVAAGAYPRRDRHERIVGIAIGDRIEIAPFCPGAHGADLEDAGAECGVVHGRDEPTGIDVGFNIRRILDGDVWHCTGPEMICTLVGLSRILKDPEKSAKRLARMRPERM